MSGTRQLDKLCKEILEQKKFDEEMYLLISSFRFKFSGIVDDIHTDRNEIIETANGIFKFQKVLEKKRQGTNDQTNFTLKTDSDSIARLHKAVRNFQGLISQSSIQNQHVVAASSQPSSTYSPRQQKTKPVSGWGIFGGILGGLLIGGAVAAVSIFTGGLGWLALGGLGLLVGSICGGMTGARHGFWAGLGTGIGTGIIAPIVAIVVAITVIACCNGGGGGGGCVFVGGCGSCGDSSDNRDNRLSQDSGRKNSHSDICKKLDVDPSTTAPVTSTVPVDTSSKDTPPPDYTASAFNYAAPTYGPLI